MHSGAEASSSSPWLCVVVKHQTLPEDQMPFLLLTPLWVCQRVSPASVTSSLCSAWGCWHVEQELSQAPGRWNKSLKQG